MIQAKVRSTTHRRRASQLETIGNVPTVAKQMELILEVQTDDFWQDVTPQMLETVRLRLRDLVKLIEADQRKPIFTDFEDEIGSGTDAPIDAGTVGTDTARFNGKVRQFLEAHRDHITLQKVRRGEQLTRQDLERT